MAVHDAHGERRTRNINCKERLAVAARHMVATAQQQPRNKASHGPLQAFSHAAAPQEVAALVKKKLNNGAKKKP